MRQPALVSEVETKMSKGRRAAALDLTKWDTEYITPAQLRFLQLRHEGYGPLAISRLLGVSLGTIKAAIARAKHIQRDYTGRKV